ncbi:MAG: integrase, partial [Cellvibrionaceae bacterium]
EQFMTQPGRIRSTKQKYQYKLGNFLDKHGDNSIQIIDVPLIENWFAELDRKGYSDGHLAFHRSCFVTFLNFCQPWINNNPAKALPYYSQIPTHIITANAAHIGIALTVCEDKMGQTLALQRDAAIFALGVSGMRRSNIRETRYTDMLYALQNPIQIDSRTAYSIQSNGKEPMEAILDQRRAKIIQRYIDNRPTINKHNRLFIVVNENHAKYLQPLSNESLLRARKKVCTLANIPVISFQKMRRLIGTNVARTHGVALAANVLGHKSGVSVIINHYYNPDKQAARRAALDTFEAYA